MGIGFLLHLDSRLDTHEFDNQLCHSYNAIFDNQSALDRLAKKLNLQELSSFISVIHEDALHLLESLGIDPAEATIPEEKWFDPATGIQSVDGLLANLDKFKGRPETIPAIEAELKWVRTVLAHAQERNVKFRFVIAD